MPGTVYTSRDDTLSMHSNRTLTYDLNVAQSGEHLISISAAQISSKDAPPGYSFHFQFLIDGRLAGEAGILADRSFTSTDLISLGNLLAGTHTLTVKSTNNKGQASYDPNLGLKDLVLLRRAAAGEVSLGIVKMGLGEVGLDQSGGDDEEGTVTSFDFDNYLEMHNEKRREQDLLKYSPQRPDQGHLPT